MARQIAKGDPANEGASQIPPHRERVKRIRSWHIERAASDNRPVAMLAVHITESGQLHSDAIGIEPEHARVIADELRIIIEQLHRLAAMARTTLTRIK